MNLPVRRRAVAVLACAAIVAAGCGDDERSAGASASAAAAPAGQPASAQPAHDRERTDDLRALTTAQAADKAQRIALVTARGSRVVEGAPGTPFTRTTFAVEETLKGRLPDRFVVQVIGGRMDGAVVESPVQPFVKGRRYILFLGPDGPAGPTIFPQAVLEVKRAGATDVVQPAPRGIRLLAAGTSKPARRTDAGPRLNDVIFSIRQYLRAQRGSP